MKIAKLENQVTATSVQGAHVGGIPCRTVVAVIRIIFK